MHPAGNMAARYSGSSASRNAANPGRNAAATSTAATGRVTRSTAASAAVPSSRSGQAVGYTMTGKALAATGKGSSATGPGSSRDARATGSTAVATQGVTGNVTSTLTTMPSRSYTTTATISEPFTLAEPICFILLVDKDIQVSASDSLLNRRHTPSSKRILKGSLLQGHEVPPVGGQSYGDAVKGRKRADAKRYVVKPLSGDMQFQCSSSEIARITGAERDLLRAIFTNSDRLNIYQNLDLLPYALGLKEGSLVKLRHRNHSTSPYEEVAAIVRYIGPLSETEMGTQFGVEVIDDAYRGQATSDGVFGKCRYFETEPDCAVFVPINKLVPPSMSQGTTHLYENVPRSKQELPNQPSELTSVGDIIKGTTVYLQVGNGMRRGRVVYMTVPHKETEPYAVVEMTKQDGDPMWNGMHRRYRVFTPRNDVFTMFVPTSDVTTHAPKDCLERNLDREILVKVSQHVNFRELCRVIDFPTEVAIYIKKSYRRNEQRVFQVLDSWKRRGDGGNRSISELLQVLAQLGCKPAVIDEITSKDAANDKEEVNPMKQLPAEYTGFTFPALTDEPQDEPCYPDLEVNSMVEVKPSDKTLFGVIRWIGVLVGSKSNKPVAGIELESSIDHGATDGTFNKQHYFQCEPNKAIFVYLSKCRPDSRFLSQAQTFSSTKRQTSQAADDKEEVNPMKQLPAEYTTITFPSLTDEPQDEPCYPDLEVNSMVEVMPSDKTLFGVIRWIGVLVGSKSNKPVAGIELESSIDHGATDGTFNKQHYFQCEPNKAIFVYLSKCRPDSRVLSQAQTFSSTKRQTSQDFGGFASPLVEGFIDPPLRLRLEFVGMEKGIQGDQNSCYMDSTLFSMFAYNGVFDPLLRHMQGQGNLQEYEKVQKTLRESIVNPLRKNGFVRADRILQLREHLDQLGTTKGLMSEKKDPEEFLHTLLSEVFKSRTLLKIRHGANKEVDESNIHQIFLDKDESLTLPTVEQLLLQSFQEHDLKLVETPSCLIVQMPRFGKDYKMCNRILPSFQLDVTDIIEGYPRQCTVCGILATFECSECKSEEALADTTHIKNYCDSCFNRMHIGTHREHHQPTLLTIPDYFLKEFLSKTMGKGFSEEEVDKHRQRLLTPKLMDLFAVICIRTSHYVAFVKAGREKDSEWVFFDSMADRQGDQQGYYIPQITHLKDFRKLVDVDHIKARIEAKQLTEIMERLLGDAYICMYSEKLHTGAALHSVGISVEDFGGFASPLVEGFIDPPALLRREFVGMQKGIQGYRNSCYLDSTLFSMFAYNGVFDPQLRRTQGQGDLQEYEKAQKTLRESIVNPLRKNGFVRADRILQLREHLDQLGTTKGLMSEKKDPEEFLHTLLSEVFKSQPLLKIRHGANKEVDESNIHQIFLDKDESLTLPTVEQLLLQSFQEHDLKLVEAPSCLIVQMPRFGKDYKMYNRILPSPQLDITNIIEEYPRQCRVCGTLAIFECSECKTEEALEDTTLIKNYCVNCFLFMHEGTHPEHHKPTTLTVPDHFIKEFFSKTMDKGFSELLVDEHRQRLLTPKMMDLFAVICIRTSHYVAFVKAGKEKDSEWVFFDSMADRQGDQQDYYIPQITHLKDFRKWVDMGHIKARIEAKQLTEIIERLLGDAYICMYSDSEQCRQTYT